MAKEVFSLCKSVGIQTVGTFIIGLPGEGRKEIEKTIACVKNLGCDYASFNIFTPAYGTKIRKELISRQLLADEISFLDSGDSYPIVKTSDLLPAEVWKLRNKAFVKELLILAV